MPSEDHDLLTSMKGDMEHIKITLDEMKKQYADTCAWKKEADREITILKRENIPKRLDDIEGWRSWMTGGVSVVGFVLGSGLLAVIWKVFI